MNTDFIPFPEVDEATAEVIHTLQLALSTARVGNPDVLPIEDFSPHGTMLRINPLSFEAATRLANLIQKGLESD